MSSLLQDNVFKIIVCFGVLFLGMNIGLELYPYLTQSEDISECDSGVIQERVERIEPTSQEGVRKVMKYYTLECSHDGSIEEVKAFKSFPIGTKIGLEWVRQ